MPDPTKQRLDRIAFDWVDGFIVVAVGVAWSIVLHVTGATSTLSRTIAVPVLIAVLLGRRKLYGAPTVEVRHSASVVGTLAAMLVVLGLLAGGLGVYLLFRDAGRAPSSTDAIDPDDADPELQDRRRTEDATR